MDEENYAEKLSKAIKGLTEKQVEFCKAYVDNMQEKNPEVKAWIAAGYACKDKNWKYKARKQLSLENVQRGIKFFGDERNNSPIVDKRYVLDNLKEVVENSSTDSARLKALELLGKHMGMFDKDAVMDAAASRDAVKKARAKRQKQKEGKVIPFQKDGTNESG